MYDTRRECLECAAVGLARLHNSAHRSATHLARAVARSRRSASTSCPNAAASSPPSDTVYSGGAAASPRVTAALSLSTPVPSPAPALAPALALALAPAPAPAPAPSILNADTYRRAALCDAPPAVREAGVEARATGTTAGSPATARGLDTHCAQARESGGEGGGLHTETARRSGTHRGFRTQEPTRAGAARQPRSTLAQRTRPEDNSSHAGSGSSSKRTADGRSRRMRQQSTPGGCSNAAASGTHARHTRRAR